MTLEVIIGHMTREEQKESKQHLPIKPHLAADMQIGAGMQAAHL